MAWERVGELADAAPDLSALRHHKLHLVAASRMRARGETPPSALVEDERRAALLALALPSLLRRVRAAYDGPVLLLKGAEVAAHWPQPHLRPPGDVDLLVEDAAAAQAALLNAGFVELYDPDSYDELHHCCPVALPGLPLTFEVHRRPHWCAGSPPSFAELVAAARPSAVGIDGVLAPRADHHAVLLAVHAWAHEPLDRIAQLVDIAAMVETCGVDAPAAVARAWGVSSLWRVTMQAIDQVVMRDPATSRLPAWKRHLVDARERTVFEGHVTHVVAPALAAPPSRAPISLLAALLGVLRPAVGESWAAKLARSVRAGRHAAWTRSRHVESVESKSAGAPLSRDSG